MLFAAKIIRGISRRQTLLRNVTRQSLIKSPHHFFSNSIDPDSDKDFQPKVNLKPEEEEMTSEESEDFASKEINLENMTEEE